MITAFTDGSCRGNPGPGGYGVIILEHDNPNLEDAKVIDTNQVGCLKTTNNREEMKAIIWAMRRIGKRFPTPIVYSDSAYCVNSFTLWIDNWRRNGWVRAGNKPLENLDLIQEYDALLKDGYRIDLKKVAGHSGVKWNEAVDGLATGRLKTQEVYELGR